MKIDLNLSTFALNNENYNVDVSLEKILKKFREQNKVICAVCIAPMILAKVFQNIKITIGNDKRLANIIENLGNIHVNTSANNIWVDKENKIITAPFYMLTDNISVIYNEAYKIIKEAIKFSE